MEFSLNGKMFDDGVSVGMLSFRIFVQNEIPRISSSIDTQCSAAKRGEALVYILPATSHWFLGHLHSLFSILPSVRPPSTRSRSESYRQSVLISLSILPSFSVFWSPTLESEQDVETGLELQGIPSSICAAVYCNLECTSQITAGNNKL